MPRLGSSLAARCTEALIAVLAPILPLAIVLLGATPVLPVLADWLPVLPALLAALLLLGRRGRLRSGRRRTSNTDVGTDLKTRTAHGFLD